MNGNPTAGILLLLGAAALIVLGVTDKGKAILQILFGTQSSGSRTVTGGTKSEGVGSSSSTPGVNAGEKAASYIPIKGT